ncbi:MAG: hypothetical protein RIF32_04910 [Leptospirales bacterium]|jgi:hypothetical protein
MRSVENRRSELVRLSKPELVDQVLAYEAANDRKEGEPIEKLRFALYSGGKMELAREICIIRESQAVLCRSIVKLSEANSGAPLVMIGASQADFQSIPLERHQVRHQSGFVGKLQFGEDLFSITVLRDREATWYTLWCNYDGPAKAEAADWLTADEAEDAAYAGLAGLESNWSETA